MSAKGCSPDNSACEGFFFGRLKNEFFHYRDWEGVTAEEFMGRLEAYLVYYREGRIKKSLGWLQPDGVPQEAWIRLGAVQEIVRTPSRSEIRPVLFVPHRGFCVI